MNDIIDQLLAGIPRDQIKEVTLVRNGERRITYKLHEDKPEERKEEEKR